MLVLLQEYKPPASKDIPIDFRIALLRDAPNPIGILGTKGIIAQSMQHRKFNGAPLQVWESPRCA